jgi:hypothetical protein
MSLSYIKSMLETIRKFERSEITLHFFENDIHILSVCYNDYFYQLTYLDSVLIEIYPDLESTVQAISKASPSN